MPLGIVDIMVVTGFGLGLSWPIAPLLAAALAPTDPVLACDIQVGPSKSEDEDEVRFGLTSEAGLNDRLSGRKGASGGRSRCATAVGRR